jgi:predicted TIM-barrel fold metal-dependent hydrolase
MLAQLKATGVAPNANQVLDIYLNANQDHDAKALLADMDLAGIETTVLLLPDFSYVLKCELTISEMFERHARIRRAHEGRFEVFAGVDPRWGADGVSLFETGVREFGFAGLKLYPPCGYDLSDRSLYPFYEICAARGLPVLSHMGPTSPVLRFDLAVPSSVDQAARDFPGVNFILAHAITDVPAIAKACAYRPNVYADISGYLGMQHPRGWRQGVAELFALGVNHKLIYGTDFPVFKLQGTQARALQEFLNVDGPLGRVAPQERGWIMQGNIRRLLAERRTSLAEPS